MSERPLVSILTPSLNHGAFLSACLQSVREQTYPNLEHIVQDGGSTDDSLEILSSAPGVFWESTQDQGQSHALNLALQRSKGDYIGVLNADDLYLPKAIAEAVSWLERHPEIAVVYGDQLNVSPEGEPLNLYSPGSWSFEGLYCVELIPPAQAAFFRRSSLEKVGFFIDSSLPTCPDYELWVRLGLEFPMLYVPQVWAYYRNHPHSETSQSQMVESMVQARRTVMERLESTPEYRARLLPLRERAECGLNLWATLAQLNCRQRLKALPYLQRAALFTRTDDQKRRLKQAVRRWFRP